MTNLPADTEPTTGHPNSPGPYTDTPMVDGYSHTAVAGTYAEGSKRAAEESARMGNGRKVTADSLMDGYRKPWPVDAECRLLEAILTEARFLSGILTELQAIRAAIGRLPTASITPSPLPTEP